MRYWKIKEETWYTNPMDNSLPQAAPVYETLGKKTFVMLFVERLRATFTFVGIAILLWIASQQSALEKIPNLGNQQHNVALLAGWALLVALAALIVAFIASWLIYTNYRYMLDDDSLKIKRGILNKEEIAIPYRQIQDINIERNLTYQMFGMSRLVILTAGHEDEPHPEGEAEGILPAIDKTLAEKLQDELLKRTDIQRVTEVGVK